MTVVGEYAYVNGVSYSLHIIDVSHPAQPVSVSLYEPARSRNIVTVGNYAYATPWITVGSNFGSILRVIDVTKPGNP